MMQQSMLYHVSFEPSNTGNMLHFPPNETISTQLNNQLNHYYNTIQNHNALFTVPSQATPVQHHHPGQPILTDLKMKHASSGKRRKQKLIAEISIPDPLPSYIEKVNRIKSVTENEDELYCDICRVYLNSVQQLGSHKKSTKHKLVKMGIIKNNQKRRSTRRFKCKPCECIMNSDSQLLHHLNSTRHKVIYKI